jgi:hypothetical protein
MTPGNRVSPTIDPPLFDSLADLSGDVLLASLFPSYAVCAGLGVVAVRSTEEWRLSTGKNSAAVSCTAGNLLQRRNSEARAETDRFRSPLGRAGRGWR